MSEPVIAAKQPCAVELEPGTYWWCSCGSSANQPFCDGSHKNTDFSPMEVKIEKKVPVTSTQKTTKGSQLTKENNLHKLYLFGVNRGRLEQMAKDRQLSLDIVNNLNDADLLITSRSYYRRKPQKIRDAELANLPIYVLKSNTPPQIRQLLGDIYPRDGPNTGDQPTEGKHGEIP